LWRTAAIRQKRTGSRQRPFTSRRYFTEAAIAYRPTDCRTYWFSPQTKRCPSRGNIHDSQVSLCVHYIQHPCISMTINRNAKSGRYPHPVCGIPDIGYLSNSPVLCCQLIRSLSIFVSASQNCSLLNLYPDTGIGFLPRDAVCLIQSAVLPLYVVRPSVRPSVTLMYCGHIGRTAWKVIAQIINLRFSFLGAPTSQISGEIHHPDDLKVNSAFHPSGVGA